MSNKEHIEAVLSLYKDAIRSYSWEYHYRDNKPLEDGFNRQIMSNTTSSLYDAVNSLFVGLIPSQADRYISIWRKQYIIQGWCADDDRAGYNRLQAIGQIFINECKRIAAEVCEPEPQGETTQRGWGYLPPDKGTAEKDTHTNVPNELATDEAQEYFAKAIQLGLMDSEYNWLKGLQMLSCFALEMSKKLNLGKGERISWKPFETLFKIPYGKLRLNYNDIQKIGDSPKESYLIDKVFE